MASDRGASAPGSALGAGLEDRLRSLILTNATNAAPGLDQSTFPPLPGATPQDRGGPSDQSGRPHVESHPAPSFNQPQQQPSFTNSPLPPGAGVNADSVAPPTSPRASRSRRPNQAQRRQMSAQLSIPIDPRPVPPPAPQSARPYVSPPAQQAHRYQPSGSFQNGPRLHPASRYSGFSQPGAAFGAPATHMHSYGPPYGDAAPGFQVLDPPRFHYPPPTVSQQEWPSRAQIESRGGRNSHSVSFNAHRHSQSRPENAANQVALLDGLCNVILADAEIGRSEIAEKESFRIKIEQICRETIAKYEADQNGCVDFPATSVQLKCFGSLMSGFATKAADMDLGLLSPLSKVQPDAPGSPIPRLLEKAFLSLGLGARLLTRTRVPIIKLCEKPPRKLYLDLLEEREKWERGLADEDADEEDKGRGNVDAGPEVANVEKGQVDGIIRAPGMPATPATDFVQKLVSLRQSEKQSLSSYYNVTKRLLGKLGGRDIGMSTYRDFGEQEFKLLNDVCRAFVRGLYDRELRERLGQYPSSPIHEHDQEPNRRSLFGVFTQVEGEKAVIAWEKLQICERNDDLHQQCLETVRSWRATCNKLKFGIDPVLYGKELQLMFSKLAKMPSVQLVLLEQGQYESPADYHVRAAKIASELEMPGSLPGADRIVALEHYVSGIWHDSIREAVQAFCRLTDPASSLNTVARRHKSLHLAMEYEKALEKGLYGPEHIDTVKQYSAILRQPMQKSLSGDLHFDYVIPIRASTVPLVKTIKTLADPSKMTPNIPRDRYHDHLEFPSDGAGVQCDINFAAHLALQNTLLLRCYSHTDRRVRPLVLFVKHWAKVRGINSSYRGTLSSYGYVLMMLHYLVNVAHPFVCPNLQRLAPQAKPNDPPETRTCKGRDVSFWRNEEEIQQLASANQLNNNQESIGSLLRGFFEYYATTSAMTTLPRKGFDWGREVLSLRTPGGLLTKQEKGWTGAKTVFQVRPRGDLPSPGNAVSSPVEVQTQESPESEPPFPTDAVLGEVSSPEAASKASPMRRGSEVKEIRHRFLFAIEDPFELEHNVARTVTHNGIVAIRDEFRRAWRIIRDAGIRQPQEDLLDNVNAAKDDGNSPFQKLLEEIHGWELFGEPSVEAPRDEMTEK